MPYEIEVLDPSEQTSMLSTDAIRARAELLAVNNDFCQTTLWALTSGNITPFIGPDQRPNARTAILNIASVNCIPILMADELGRGNMHIAGEVCRIVTETVHVADSWGIKELAQFVKIIKAIKTESEFWTYKGSDYLFPTIDGGIARPKTVLSLEYPGYVDMHHSLHNDWLQNFVCKLLPQNEKIAPIIPPFKLNSGRRIADHTERFYATRRKGY